MKKLLALLGAASLVTSASTVVVACGDKEEGKDLNYYDLQDTAILKGTTTTIKVTADVENVEITASSSDESIITIEKNVTKATTEVEYTITAKNEGTAKVIFEAEGYKKLEVEVKVTSEVGKALNDSIEVIQTEAGFNTEAEIQTALDAKFVDTNITAATSKTGTPADESAVLVVYTKDDSARWISEAQQKYNIEIFEAEATTDALTWKEEATSTGTANAKMLTRVQPTITTNFDDQTIELDDINGDATLEITLIDPKLNSEGKLMGNLSLDNDAIEGESGIDINLEEATAGQEVVKGKYLKVVFLGIENNSVVKLKLTAVSSTEGDNTLSIDYDDAETKEITYNINVA